MALTPEDLKAIKEMITAESTQAPPSVATPASTTTTTQPPKDAPAFDPANLQEMIATHDRQHHGSAESSQRKRNWVSPCGKSA